MPRSPNKRSTRSQIGRRAGTRYRGKLLHGKTRKWLLGRDESGARRVEVNVIAGALDLVNWTPNPTNRTNRTDRILMAAVFAFNSDGTGFRVLSPILVIYFRKQVMLGFKLGEGAIVYSVCFQLLV